MMPGRHEHRERATGCPGGTAHTGGSGWPTVSSTRRGGEHGHGGHGQAVPGSDSDEGHWARQDFTRVGQFQGGCRIRPMAI
jgi:hypothetical protein